MEILNRIVSSLQNNLPFVAYKKPNATIISGFFQQNDELYYSKDYSESGFVFAPFDDENPSVLIPKTVSEFMKEKLFDFKVETLSNLSFSSDEKAKEKHLFIVDKAIKAIKNNEFRKVVISRKEVLEESNFSVIEVFKKLLLMYSEAMVYVWFHPKVGLWLGATPETLLKITENNFETMSLAGTQVFKGTTNVTWKPKEIDEQQVVTDYICANLQPISSNISVCNVETTRAGSLLHLRTRISGELRTSNLELISALHPTPAVCGYPKKEAKQFIIGNEGYHRDFYTGFLGELNIKQTSDLYVNLRCMQVERKKVIIYVGGGITLESNSDKEWEETVAKSKIMRNALG